eukprot:CAMPEP_0195085348 /NCGR_PEP_ID=MMETSP0448-20130528/25796_1 /TAXON_ID=66468 /ORGANISM="Heterocapsa triquestra, Strain CCMP 448" /LENGTH=55 /DNA_ID=CAMNT_0040118743 /DNA_START=51 /DNA_END=218 /DNA_ORIENTATION=+
MGKLTQALESKRCKNHSQNSMPMKGLISSTVATSGRPPAGAVTSSLAKPQGTPPA